MLLLASHSCCCCCGAKPWKYYVLLFCSGEGESVHIDDECDATGLLGHPLRFGVDLGFPENKIQINED